MKINKYLAYSLLLAGGLFVSCDDYENSIDDYPLNYPIPSVAPNPNIPVGAYLLSQDFTTSNEIWNRMIGPYNDAPVSQGGGNIGPYLIPTQGRYRFEQTDTASATVCKNIVTWAKQAGIDFLITPVRSHRWDVLPKNLNSNDTMIVNLISGRVDTFGYANRGEIKYAILYDLANFSTMMGPARLSNNNLLENAGSEPIRQAQYVPWGWPTYTDAQGTVRPMPPYPKDTTFNLTRETRLYDAFKRLSVYFKDPTYQTTPDGRPLLFLETSNDDLLYTSDQKRVYDNIRDTIFKYCGKHVYLIARQQQWTPTARFEYFFVQGAVDAITPKALTAAENWTRVYTLNQYINEHMKGNKDYLNKYHPNIDYIPSVSPSYNGYVDTGSRNSGTIIIPKNEKGFRERCNVAKMNVGRMPMIIVDSFNDWKRDTQIEPSDPDYGNGYGTFYLDILRSELKGR